MVGKPEGSCRVGYYTNNIPATRRALVCAGGFGQPPCVYLDDCLIENGMRREKARNGNHTNRSAMNRPTLNEKPIPLLRHYGCDKFIRSKIIARKVKKFKKGMSVPRFCKSNHLSKETFYRYIGGRLKNRKRFHRYDIKKIKEILKYGKNSKNVWKTCRHYNISSSLYYTWRRKFQKRK